MKTRKLKCVFCKYKEVCIPEQEKTLTKYKQVLEENANLQIKVVELGEKLDKINNYIKENSK